MTATLVDGSTLVSSLIGPLRGGPAVLRSGTQDVPLLWRTGPQDDFGRAVIPPRRAARAASGCTGVSGVSSVLQVHQPIAVWVGEVEHRWHTLPSQYLGVVHHH